MNMPGDVAIWIVAAAVVAVVVVAGGVVAWRRGLAAKAGERARRAERVRFGRPEYAAPVAASPSKPQFGRR